VWHGKVWYGVAQTSRRNTSGHRGNVVAVFIFLLVKIAEEVVNFPIALNLVTASAPRPFRAREPGSERASRTLARGASFIAVASKFSSKSTKHSVPILGRVDTADALPWLAVRQHAAALNL
jgi:hypothetical protein